MHTYTLTPTDLLFFRDARPIETSGGHGARWPEPSVIFDAIHAALWRAFPDGETLQHWEHKHDFGRSSCRPRNGDTQRFGSLTTAGLFPVWKDGRWLFPAPGDTTCCSQECNWLLQPFTATYPSGRSDLPAPLKYPLGNFAPPTKDTVAPWWTAAAWQNYLHGKKPGDAELFASSALFSAEWMTGIGIDPETQTQDRQRIYSAEYLRLRPEVQCGFLASLRMKQNGNPANLRECIDRLFTATQTIIVGGQQRSCRVEPFRTDSLPLPRGFQTGFNRLANGKYAVKWTLLTPAIWPAIMENEARGIRPHHGGWLPNWICSDIGAVLLKHRMGQVRRVWSESSKRTIRRADSESAIDAHIVAACVPKPVPVTGWTERLHLLRNEGDKWKRDGQPGHGPRAAHLAVPAGAVYYFEAEADKEGGPGNAIALAGTLNWHGPDDQPTTIKNRRSTLLGEKGYGLGVCGTWDFYPSAAHA
jgi:CRISPR-associated protein Cmr3